MLHIYTNFAIYLANSINETDMLMIFSSFSEQKNNDALE